MSDKPSPVDDLKEGLGLIFRAAKTAASRIPTGKLEGVAKDAAKEVSRAFESLGDELDRAFGGKPVSRPEPPPPAPTAGGAEDAPSEGEPPAAPEAGRDHDAPPSEAEPPKGPRVG